MHTRVCGRSQEANCGLSSVHHSSPDQLRAIHDSVLAFGEALSSLLLADVLNERGVMAIAVDARECIITDDEFGCAAPLMEETFAATQSVLLPFLETVSDLAPFLFWVGLLVQTKRIKQRH